jgi:hypothetical protein
MAKEKKREEVKKKSEKKRHFKFPEPPKPFCDFFRPRPRFLHARPDLKEATIGQLCELLNSVANQKLTEDCTAKEFSVESMFRPCVGGGGDAAKKVDLVVVIDTSGSMSGEAVSLSGAADAAIEAAKKSCPSDLRVSWLGIEGTFSDTKFDTKLRDYLHSLGVADSVILGRRIEDIGMAAQEDGARAIQDICNHFDWRSGASRAIFFLGDEPLEGGEPQTAEDKIKADEAVATANSKNVTIFTYAGSGIEYFVDSTTGITAVDEYSRIASATGGVSYSYGAGDIGEFQQVLQEIICASVNAGCSPVRLPEIRPCFTLRWGGGPGDRIETDDVEVLCLTASNPYTNVILKNVTAFIIVMSSTGLPEKLPDGTPSVSIKPYSMICLGDLPPCGVSDLPSTVSREIVLISRGAKEDTYYVFVVYCYSVEFSMAFGSVFPIEIVRS